MVPHLVQEQRDQPVLPEGDDLGEGVGGSGAAGGDADHQIGRRVIGLHARHDRGIDHGSPDDRVRSASDAGSGAAPAGTALGPAGAACGAEEDRTPNLGIANAALSQLSYRPV